jgi:hypothetical protein
MKAAIGHPAPPLMSIPAARIPSKRTLTLRPSPPPDGGLLTPCLDAVMAHGR